MASPPPNSVVAEVAKNTLPQEEVKDETWYRPPLSAARWDKLYPFQLIVLDKTDQGYSPRKKGGWVFTLPIPPQSLTISMPFAISSSITMGGSVEEHNGAPIRMIELSGTTGVLPTRGEAPRPDLMWVNSIAGGSINSGAVTNALASNILNRKNPPLNSIDAKEFEDSGPMGKYTGYYQFQLLKYFLESYAALKKTAVGRNARLALAIWKEESVYLVTPQSFVCRRSASAPLEYQYSLSFKSTKRVQVNDYAMQGDFTAKFTPVSQNPKAMAAVMQRIDKTRETLQSVQHTLKAIRGDVDRTLNEPLRQASLMIKDAMGIPLALSDLQKGLIQSVRPAVMKYIAIERTVRSAVWEGLKEAYEAIFVLKSETDDQPYQTWVPTTHALTADVANDPFENPSDYPELFSQIPVGDLDLSPAEMAKIAEAREEARNLTGADFAKMRDDVNLMAAEYANAVGLGSDTYNESYGLTSPTAPVVGTPSDEDYQTLFALNEAGASFSELSMMDAESTTIVDAMSTVAGMATRSGIAFQMPVSKFAVPFPYGATLEGLANRYLGDPTRWHEIAAMNGLQAPYVDEVGFDIPLLVNGSDNTIVVGSTDRLYVDQPVWLSSNSTTRTSRRIMAITRRSNGQVELRLSGDPDLERFTTINQAVLHAFLPNTVNSQMLVFIPSTEDPGIDDHWIRKIPGVDEHDSLITVGGVDLLLTPNNDLALTPDGNTKWSAGLTNLVQKVRLALSVRRGMLNRHPTYGIDLDIGANIADLDVKELAKAAEEVFANDPSYGAVRGARITVNGPSTEISVAIEVAGTNRVIPISVQP